MSYDSAKAWFDNHPHEIPAIDANLSEILSLLDEEHQTHNLVKFAVRDPGLILAILKKININRGPDSGRDVVESPQAALSMMGSQVTQSIFRESKTAENIVKDPEQLFLFQQITERSYHNQFQAEYWAREKGFKQIDKLSLAALLAYTGELLCCIYDYENYKDYALAGSTDQQAQIIFGFQFAELTEVICESSNLPELISMLQPHTENVSQPSNLLHFTSILCQRCEHGWYNDEVYNSLVQFSEYFHIPLDKVISKTHEFAVTAARASFIPESWEPASRLILIKDSVWKPKSRKAAPDKTATTPARSATSESSIQNQSQSAEKKQATESASDIIRRLVKMPDVSQSEILKTCVLGIQQDVGMSKVALMLFSKDKKSLLNRMTLGIDNNSSFKNYTIPIESSGIFKLLLNKPMAVWVNPSTIQKFQRIIPDSLSSNIKTDNFCTMSLFIASKPIGIIYADQSDSNTSLDEKTFSQFKQLITLASKALTLIAKKQQSK